MTIPEGFAEQKPERRIDILQAESDGPSVDAVLARFLDASAAFPRAWRDWQGENGTWRIDVEPTRAVPEGSKERTRLSASYQGPTMATCRLVVDDRSGERLQVTAPMPHDVDDDGPAMFDHVREMAQAAILAHHRMPGRRTGGSSRQGRIGGRWEHGTDPQPWLLAATVLADGAPPRDGEADPPYVVALPSPWSPTTISGESGFDLRLPPDRVAAFDAVCPKGLRVQVVTRFPGGLVSGQTNLHFEALDAIPGETMPALDDAVARLRAAAMASAAGAFPDASERGRP